MVTDATQPSVLQLHLTDVPGWRATIDGHPLALRRYDYVMLEAQIPPGRHDVNLTYWPRTFTVGLVLAGLAMLSLLTAGILGMISSRRRNRLPSAISRE